MKGVFTIAGVAALASSGSAAGLDEYGCSFCVSSVEKAIEMGETMLIGCKNIFPDDICEWTFSDQKFGSMSGRNLRLRDGGVRQLCVEHDRCLSLEGEEWRQNRVHSTDTNRAIISSRRSDTSNLDIRISKAYGSRGYDKVRVSVISSDIVDSDIFTYSEPFQYRWTQYYLNTGVTTIIPGQVTTLRVGNEDIDVYVPSEGDGVRGLVVGDPCFSSEYITCVYRKPFDMFNRSVTIMNELFKHDDIHFWNILGDNFYDQVSVFCEYQK